MPFWEDIKYRADQLRNFVFGRGLIWMLMAAAVPIGGMLGVGPLLAAAVAGIGGVALRVGMRLVEQANYEQGMVNLYRDEIGQQLEIAPQSVTRQHLKIAARDNDVIDQALKKQQRKTYLTVVTSVLAGVTTFGLLAVGLGTGLHEWFAQAFPSGLLAGAAQFIGMGTVVTASNLVVDTGLNSTIKRGTGLWKAAAHDRIMDIDRTLRHGKRVTKEQVFAVKAAGDIDLQETILKHYGKRYRFMDPVEKQAVLIDSGMALEMQMLANQLNHGELKPSMLVHMFEPAKEKPQQLVAAANYLVAEPVRLQAKENPMRSHVARLGREAQAPRRSFQEELTARREAHTSHAHAFQRS
jgi:hypothetical protein